MEKLQPAISKQLINNFGAPSYESIEFKLTETYLDSPLQQNPQNSLTYTASMETVEDNFRYYY